MNVLKVLGSRQERAPTVILIERQLELLTKNLFTCIDMFSSEQVFQDLFCVNSLCKLAWCSLKKCAFRSHSEGKSLLHSKHLGIGCFPGPWCWWWTGGVGGVSFLGVGRGTTSRSPAFRLRSRGVSVRGRRGRGRGWGCGGKGVRVRSLKRSEKRLLGAVGRRLRSGSGGRGKARSSGFDLWKERQGVRCS